jgi:hypothetical protein
VLAAAGAAAAAVAGAAAAAVAVVAVATQQQSEKLSTKRAAAAAAAKRSRAHAPSARAVRRTDAATPRRSWTLSLNDGQLLQIFRLMVLPNNSTWNDATYIYIAA